MASLQINTSSLPPVGLIPISLARIAIGAGRLEVIDIKRQVGIASPGLDVVHV